jgi:hypothetical protein
LEEDPNFQNNMGLIESTHVDGDNFSLKSFPPGLAISPTYMYWALFKDLWNIAVSAVIL